MPNEGNNYKICTEFEKFIKQIVLNKKSYLKIKNDSNTPLTPFTAKKLQELVDRYVVNYIGSVGKDEHSKHDDYARELLKEINNKSARVNENNLDKCGRVKKDADIKDEVKKQLVNDLNYDLKLTEQFTGKYKIFSKTEPISDDAILLFANLMWLRYLPMSKKKITDSAYGETAVTKIKNTIELTKNYHLEETSTLFETNEYCIPYGQATIYIDNEMTDLVLMFNEMFKESTFKTVFKYEDNCYSYSFNNNTLNIVKNEKSQWRIEVRAEDVQNGEQKKYRYVYVKDKVEMRTAIRECKLENNNVEDLKQIAWLATIKQFIIRWCLDLPLEKDEYDKGKGVRSQAYASIKEAVKNTGEGRERKNPASPLPIHNMLLFMCDPEHYDNISVTGDKKKIVETFKGLVTEDDINNCPFLDSGKITTKKDLPYNKYLWSIYEKLNETRKTPQDVKIYDEPYGSLWSPDLDQINALKYKKAMVLYGPPGTSKTYTAKQLAKTIIYHTNYSTNFSNYKNDLDNGDIEKRIHRLQLHPNYTYEDFIWGYQIENNATKPKKGYFLRMLDEVIKDNKDNDKNHVLILDEINRVDLSRLFGELFSAIENRNEPVDLPVNIEGMQSTNVNGFEVSQISVPENLFIIGTMNEIDFSLERVDFALRRRFVWEFYGYNANSLQSIIEAKSNDSNNLEKNIKGKSYTKLEDFLYRCNTLNKSIDEHKDLGKQYEIGHTFFAEIIDIMKSGENYTEAKKILWRNSIKPMLEAFLGNCDEKEKADMLKESSSNSKKKETFADIFLGPSIMPESEGDQDAEVSDGAGNGDSEED